MSIKKSIRILSLIAILGISFPVMAGFNQTFALAKSGNAQAIDELKLAFNGLLVYAQKGDAVAQNMIGKMYFYGVAIPQDREKAIQWYQKSADQGNLEAQFWLGNAYLTGSGISKNEIKAFEWFKVSADKGFPPSQAMLGDLYISGKGVDKNSKNALEYYDKSCKAGLKVGCISHEILSEALKKHKS